MKFENINIRYNNKIIYDNYQIEIKDKKITAIVGESGIGKTSLLEYLTDKFIENNISFSYVFQEYNLIPWKTVEENLKFIYDNKCIMSIDEVLKIVKLLDSKDKYPSELSGGMKQRVNLARSILKPGEIMVLDEAFKSIDLETKNHIVKEIKKIIHKYKLTCILVTHDIDEAKTLSDVIINIKSESQL